MTEEVLVKYDTPRGEVALSVRAVRALCPKATPEEIALFVKVCLYHRLNPFLREVYLIKYDERALASIVVGKDTFTQRAEQDPAFDGFAAGVIVMHEGQAQPVESKGAFLAGGDTLVGGWAEVYRKDRAHPFCITVSMAEYNRNQSSWRAMPATMIRKVALVQALREAFPGLFVGLYDSAEMANTDAIEGVKVPIAPEPEAAPIIMGEAAPPTGQTEPPMQPVSTLPTTLPTTPASPGAASPSHSDIPQFKNWGEFAQWVNVTLKHPASEALKALNIKSWSEYPGTHAEAAAALIEIWGLPREEG